ncbi:MAG: hypothetical protein EBV07_00770 [Proteobacteria bacterium]|nr:hypothetical protein [Pseudomonadota bacterium]
MKTGFKNSKYSNFGKSFGGKPKLSDTDKRYENLAKFFNFLSSSLSLLLIGIFAVFIIYSKDLPDPNRLSSKGNESGTKLLDRNGKPIFELYGDKNRVLIKLEDVSPNVLHATLSAEDAEFFIHSGFSVRGMARAVKNTLTGEGLQGGSTLTQQVVKNALLTQDRTVDRKIKELILSLQIESKYNKDEILQMYFNETPYGGQNYGIFAAAKAYFAKDPKDLTLSESAYLAGLPQRPSYYSPFSSNKEAGIERRNFVLSKAPHFVFYVKDELIKMFGEDVVESGGLEVKTSLDIDVQENAEKIMTKVLETESVYGVGNAASVVFDTKTGEILSMIGSKNYFGKPEPVGCESATTGSKGCKFDPFFNVAVANRQPGSAIKPLTYAGLLERGFTPAFTFLDVPTTFTGEGVGTEGAYVPVNYDGTYKGPISMRKSLGNSLNIPAVKALKILGLQNFLDLSKKMGINSFGDKSKYGLSITLGGGETQLLELTSSYTVFGNKGIYNKPVSILEIKNRKGEVVYSPDRNGERALSEETAFLISDILSDDFARSAVFGLNSLLKIPNHQVAVKTGTTNNKRDNYAVGFSPSYTVGVWVGNSNNEPLNERIASGISGATPIWAETMKFLLKDKPTTGDKVEKFSAPETVKKVEIDERTGMLPYKDFPKRFEWFVKGTEPLSVSDWYQTVEVCKEDGRIANEDCKKADETDTKTYIGIKDYYPDWQIYTDAWLQEKFSKDDTYFPPTIISKLKYDGGDLAEIDPYIKIVAPQSSTNVPLKFRISTEISASEKVKNVKFYFDDKEVGEDSSYPFGFTFKLNEGNLGLHKFKAKVTDKNGNESSDEIILNVVNTIKPE